MVLMTILMAAAAGALPQTDVRTQASAGNVLCANPDEATRTCSAIDAFAPAGEDTFINTGEVLLSPTQGVTLEVSSTVRVENGTICGAIEMEDLHNATVRVNGSLLPPAANAEALRKMAAQLKPLAGRMVCEALRVEAGQLVKYGQVEGIDRNLPGKPVKWVGLGDGYRVARR